MTDTVPPDVWNIRVVVDAALRKAGMSHKEAALHCKIDPSEWSKAIRGQARLDLGWIVQLPWRFQQSFIPLYVLAVTERALTTWAESAGLPPKADRPAKAHLRTQSDARTVRA